MGMAFGLSGRLLLCSHSSAHGEQSIIGKNFLQTLHLLAMTFPYTGKSPK
jgi:hypothetical protein